MLASSSGEGRAGFQHMQTLVLAPLVLGQGSVTPREAPRGPRQLPCPAKAMERDPLLPIPSYLLVSQQELQVTLSPVGVRLRPWLQLVPLVIPAVQVLHAQRQG